MSLELDLNFLFVYDELEHSYTLSTNQAQFKRDHSLVYWPMNLRLKGMLLVL